MSFAAVASAINPTAWFRLNEADKAATVSGGTGISGTVPGTGVTLGSVGLIGTADTAAAYDGTSSILVSGLPTGFSGAFSFFCVFTFEGSTSSTYQLFSHRIDANDYIQIFTKPNDDIECRAVIGGTAFGIRRSGVSLSASTAYRLAIVLDTGAARRELYLDGSESGSNITSGVSNTDVEARLGARNSDILQLDGTLDEVLLDYGTAWTAAQVALLDNAAAGNGGPNAHYYNASQGAAA